MVLQRPAHTRGPARPANNYLWIICCKLNIFISCRDHLLRSTSLSSRYVIPSFYPAWLPGSLCSSQIFFPRVSQISLSKYKDINQSVISINLNDQQSHPCVGLCHVCLCFTPQSVWLPTITTLHHPTCHHRPWLTQPLRWKTLVVSS